MVISLLLLNLYSLRNYVFHSCHPKRELRIIDYVKLCGLEKHGPAHLEGLWLLGLLWEEIEICRQKVGGILHPYDTEDEDLSFA